MKRIIAQNISKMFQIGCRENQSALEKVISPFLNKESKRALQALEDVSFSAHEGEVLGIIGRNGSGKSTLLRIIAGIIETDTGTIETNGKIVPAIRLDAGVRIRLTMGENIYLLCDFLGYGRTETGTMFGSIVDYSELKDFVDTKWYQFSDGMKQKIVFSVIVHTRPDILLLDEVFSVGDEKFRQKGFETLKAFAKSGATILV